MLVIHGGLHQPATRSTPRSCGRSKKKDVIEGIKMKKMKKHIDTLGNVGEKLSNRMIGHHFSDEKIAMSLEVKPHFQTHSTWELTNQPRCFRLRTPLSPRPPARRRDSNLMEASGRFCWSPTVGWELGTDDFVAFNDQN